VLHPRAAPWRRAVAFGVVALLAACVQPPAKPMPAREAAAIDANRRGEALFRRGDVEGALRYYREALRISQSIEYLDGIAANAINLSIAYQRLGRLAEARASAALLTDPGPLAFPPPVLAQASLRQALLDYDERNLDGAAEWAERAAEYCRRQGCPLAGAIDNVKGQLALDSGRIAAAADSAKSALDSSRAAGDRAEVANALRLLGSIALRNGEGTSAQARFGEALEIDRPLAVPRKIYLDLIGLGRAGEMQGERALARSYYERAAAVAAAERDNAALAETRALLDRLDRNR